MDLAASLEQQLQQKAKLGKDLRDVQVWLQESRRTEAANDPRRRQLSSLGL